MCELDHSVSDFEVDELPTLSVYKKEWHHVTVAHEQQKKTKASVESSPGQSMSAPKRTPAKAVAACLRNRALPSARRKATARQADVAWPTVGPAGGRHTAERPHLQKKKGIGPRVRCKSLLESEGTRRHRRDEGLPWKNLGRASWWKSESWSPTWLHRRMW